MRVVSGLGMTSSLAKRGLKPLS